MVAWLLLGGCAGLRRCAGFGVGGCRCAARLPCRPLLLQQLLLLLLSWWLLCSLPRCRLLGWTGVVVHEALRQMVSAIASGGSSKERRFMAACFRLRFGLVNGALAAGWVAAAVERASSFSDWGLAYCRWQWGEHGPPPFAEPSLPLDSHASGMLDLLAWATVRGGDYGLTDLGFLP